MLILTADLTPELVYSIQHTASANFPGSEGANEVFCIYLFTSKVLIPTVDLIHRLVYFIHYFVSTNFPGLEGTDERLCIHPLTQVPSLQQIFLGIDGLYPVKRNSDKLFLLDDERTSKAFCIPFLVPVPRALFWYLLRPFSAPSSAGGAMRS